MSTLNGGSAIVKDSLVLYYDFASEKSYSGTGSTGSVVYDLSPSGYSGIISGTTSPTFSNGVMSFDGVNHQLINLGKTTPLLYPGTSDYTWSAWLKFGSKTTGRQIWFGQAGGGILGFGVFLVYSAPDNLLGTEIRGSTGLRERKFYSVQSQLNKWQHYALVINQSAGLNIDGFYTMNLYVGGVSASTFTFSNWISIVQQPGYSAVIGAHGALPEYSPINQYDGSIGPIMIYRKALSASEVSQNYKAIKPRFGL